MKQGYRAIALADLVNARILSRALEKSGYFFVLSDIHRPVGGSGTSNKIKDETDVEV